MAGRRSNGEGTLYRDKSRKGHPWVFEQRATLPDGSSRRIKTRGKSQAAAIDRMNTRIAELRVTGDATMTVEAYLQSWLDHKEPLVKASTIRGYRQDVNLHIVPLLGPVPLGRVRTWDAQSVIDSITKAGHLVMADRVRRTMLQAFQHAVNGELLTSNPVAKVSKVRTPAPKRGSWTKEQARLFIEHAHALGSPWAALFITAVSTGARKGELIALRRTDLTGASLRIERAFTPYGDEPFTRPKSASGIRAVPIPPIVAHMLEQHIAASPASELLFPSWDGGPLNPRTITTRFNEAINAAGVPRIRFHDLRRTYATWLLKGGTDMKVAQRQIGHAGPRLLLEVYADAQGDGAAVEVGGVSGGDSPVLERYDGVRFGGARRHRRRKKRE